ncbi:glycosyltransferase [Lactobacillus amylovorus]|uniref:glycosyltransferase n=1 Tax=Lactobacillus amylovorus TaxID=1604 RepID=UPI003F9746E5
MDINSKKVVIMMATYNGEKYIQDQIESLQNQTFTNWELYISDDNSTDRTVDIIKNIQNKEDRIKKIIRNDSSYHGAYANYFNILYYVKKNCSKYDYYFYCDQDDVWLPNKIEDEVKGLVNIENKYSRTTPAFVYCDLELCDPKCNPIHDKMSNHIRTQFIKNPYNNFFKEQYVWGTSMAHNIALWNLLFIEDPNKVGNIVTHDGYISRYAAVYGKIKYISKPLILYRRTNNNVSGTPGTYKIISQKLLKLPTLIRNAANVYWGSLYFAYHVPKETTVIKDLKKCFRSGKNIRKFFIKYNILKNERVLGKLSTNVIMYTKLYKFVFPFNQNKIKYR